MTDEFTITVTREQLGLLNAGVTVIALAKKKLFSQALTPHEIAEAHKLVAMLTELENE